MIRCIGYELYKFMVQKKGILIFVVYFIFKIISVVTSPGVQHNIENIRQIYLKVFFQMNFIINGLCLKITTWF